MENAREIGIKAIVYKPVDRNILDGKNIDVTETVPKSEKPVRISMDDPETTGGASGVS